MAVKKFKQIQPEANAMQYDGTNADEMVFWAPDYLEIRDGKLMQKRNPFPIAVTEWVLLYATTEKAGQYFRMPDDVFILTWT